MARWSQERYEQMKKLFDDNKITKKDRAQFEVASTLRYLRHCRLIDATDDEIVAAVNQSIQREDLRKGDMYTPGCLPWEK